MSARATAVFLAVLTLLWVLLPRLRPATDDVSAVRDAEDRLDLAAARGDIRSLDRMIGGDFSMLGAGGNRETRSELLDRIRNNPWKIETLRQKNLEIHFYGETAVVTGADRIESRNAAGQDRTGIYRFLHVFEKRNGRWLLIAGLGSQMAVP
ncbi:MAG TPA: nuclear transport factor 2 family protein [Patescibacteria group bacterium]|nr:nuclear transport factor 2 family protein [Patescibacteria group bacterium]